MTHGFGLHAESFPQKPQIHSCLWAISFLQLYRPRFDTLEFRVSSNHSTKPPNHSQKPERERSGRCNSQSFSAPHVSFSACGGVVLTCVTSGSSPSWTSVKTATSAGNPNFNPAASRLGSRSSAGRVFMINEFGSVGLAASQGDEADDRLPYLWYRCVDSPHQRSGH